MKPVSPGIGLVILALAIAAAIPISGCVQPDTPREEGSITIAQGTQYRGGTLRIGLISVSGDSAALALLDESVEPAQNKNIDLRVGESASFGGYLIENLGAEEWFGGFMPGQSSGSVTLNVTALSG